LQQAFTVPPIAEPYSQQRSLPSFNYQIAMLLAEDPVECTLPLAGSSADFCRLL